MTTHVRALIGALMIWMALHAPIVHAQGLPSGPRAARALARGAVLAVEDIAVDSGAAVPQELIGMVTRRVMRAGEALRAPAVGRPIMIHAGSPVTVTSSAGAIAVSRAGTALYDAGIGDSVRVRLDSRTMVIGVVQDAATVRISTR